MTNNNNKVKKRDKKRDKRSKHESRSKQNDKSSDDRLLKSNTNLSRGHISKVK